MARILVDMDGVLANWGARYDEGLNNWGGVKNSRATVAIPRTKDQRSFDLKAGLTTAERDIVSGVMSEPGFYLDLKPIPGAIAALLEMAKVHDVWICTSPLESNPRCAEEKLAWVEQYLGAQWAYRVILTHQKAEVPGDLLIDDRPDIPDAADASWQQVLFDQPYNGESRLPRISSWSEWRDTIDPLIAALDMVAADSGEVRMVSETGGEKGAKPQRYDLVPVLPLDLLAELYGNGAKKYAAHNWRSGYAWSLSYAAAMRHLTRFWNGEDIDPEMGLPHVTAAAFHLFALAQFMQDFPEYDDRHKPIDSAVAA